MTVSILAVPLFVMCLALCAVATYAVGPWAAVLLVAIVAASVLLTVRRPDHREGALAAVAGGVLGFGGVMVIALLRVVS